MVFGLGSCTFTVPMFGLVMTAALVLGLRFHRFEVLVLVSFPIIVWLVAMAVQSFETRVEP